VASSVSPMMWGALEKRRVGFEGGLFVYDRVISHEGGSTGLSQRHAPWWPFQEGTEDLRLIDLYEGAVNALGRYHIFEIWAIRHPEADQGQVYVRLEFDLSQDIKSTAKKPRKRWIKESTRIYLEDFLDHIEMIGVEHVITEIGPHDVVVDFPVHSESEAALLGRRLHDFIYSTNLTAAVIPVWLTRQ